VIVHLSDPAAVGVSVAAWLLIGLTSGYYFNRLPVSRFAHDNIVTRERSFEAHGAVYQRYLRIGRWKDRLPEAGDFFAGGFSKRHLTQPLRGTPQPLRRRDPPGGDGALDQPVRRTALPDLVPSNSSAG
jgi:hypothetical protein